MFVFLDFEASSLSKASYPVEVGWVYEHGSGESHLIRPAPGWTEWDESAAAVHGITREQLEHEGQPHELICAKLISLAASHTLTASAPSWDGHWLSMLLRASGQPRHLIRLTDTDEAFLAAARKRGGDTSTTRAIVDAARTRAEAAPVAHRALPDAQREWSIWRMIVEGTE
jgi:hypothetical protein